MFQNVEKKYPVKLPIFKHTKSSRILYIAYQGPVQEFFGLI